MAFIRPTVHEVCAMTKSFVTLVFLVLLAALLFGSLRPRGAEAMIQPTVVDAQPQHVLVPSLPHIRGPFDTTPITPVESAGAPMYE